MLPICMKKMSLKIHYWQYELIKLSARAMAQSSFKSWLSEPLMRNQGRRSLADDQLWQFVIQGAAFDMQHTALMDLSTI